MFKLQKAKDYKNLPKKTLETFNSTKYIQTIKYDGFCVSVHKQGDSIRFFTSDMKEFYMEAFAEELQQFKEDFILIGEYIYDCDGKLGSRKYSTKLTTFRTNFNKGLSNDPDVVKKGRIVVFDMLREEDEPASSRFYQLTKLTEDCTYFNSSPKNIVYGKDAWANNKALVAQGYEGSMLMELDSKYEQGRKVNHAIKLKDRLTTDLLCVGTTDGEGKHLGRIGALILKDSQGLTVQVGTGLSDTDREQDPRLYIGNIIEMQYESVEDTYIQPVFICIRDDKEVSD